MEGDGGRILAGLDEKMKKALEALGRELATVRTGRANPSLVEHLRVEYHGVPTPLNQLAGISSPEPRLIVIQPWDRGALPQIEKAILKSDLGLTPTNDGRLLRLPIPTLTEERRHELVKLVRRRLEEGKVALRQVRREAAEALRDRLKEKLLSQDQEKLALEQLQRLTDAFMARAEALGQAKEAEVLEV